MRESKPDLMLNKSGEICGLILEPGFCGEQERGISQILEAVGALGNKESEVRFKGLEGNRCIHVPASNMVGFAETAETKNTVGRTFLYFDTDAWREQSIPSTITPKTLTTSGIWGKPIFFRGAHVEFNKKKAAKLCPEWMKTKTEAAQWDDKGFAVLATTAGPLEATARDIHTHLTSEDRIQNLFFSLIHFSHRPSLFIGFLDRIDVNG